MLTNLVLEIQKYTAEQERKKLLERQQQGIKLAKEHGAYKGSMVQYSKDTKNPQRKLIYNTVVSMLNEKQMANQSLLNKSLIKLELPEIPFIV